MAEAFYLTAAKAASRDKAVQRAWKEQDRKRLLKR